MLDDFAKTLIKSLPLFKDMAIPEMELLCQAASIQARAKGSHIFIRNDPAKFFYIVMNGWVKLYRDTHEGDEVILGLLTRGDVFGETSIFSGEAHSFNAQAVEDAVIITIPASALKERIMTDANILVYLLNSFTQQMNKLQLENEHLSVMSAPQRVGCLLLQLVRDPHAASETVAFPYEKSLAATRLGMKPETFSRALAQLKKIGIHVTGNSIQISNLPELVHFICSDCSACSSDCHFSAANYCHSGNREKCSQKSREI